MGSRGTSLNKYLTLSIIKISGLLFLGSFMVHQLSTPTTTTVYYLLVLIFIIRTRDNILCFTLLFIMFLAPWELFLRPPFCWMFRITDKVGVNFQPVFILGILLKFLYHPSLKLKKDLFSPYYKFFTGYVIFLIFWGLIFGHSSRSVYYTLVSLPSLILFLLLPRMFNYKELILFNRLIFIFSLFHIFISFVDILLSGWLTSYLIFGLRGTPRFFEEGKLIRLSGGIGIALYTVIMTLYYLVLKKKIFQTWYLWGVLFFSILYIINSATRGWILATLCMFLFFCLYYFKEILTKKRIAISAIVIIIFGFILLPSKIKENLGGAITRLSTVEAVAKGDLTAEGTARRWNIRGPWVLTRFHESPIFGFGFSKITYDYYDAHVGNHHLLLIGGIVGTSIIWLISMSMVLFLYLIEKKNKYCRGIFVFGLALIAIMIIHSTNRIMVSFMMPADISFLIAILFNHINAHAQESNFFLEEALKFRSLNN